MKGVIFNLVEDVVTDAHGEATWDALLASAALDGVFTSLGDYDDAAFFALVDAAAQAAGQSRPEALRWVGSRAVPRMYARWPHVFAAHQATADFIHALNGIIHPEVHKLYPGARCPRFHVGIGRDGGISLAYRSPRRLCALAHGFIDGVASHYGETVEVEHVSCMHDGASSCELVLHVS